MTGADIIELERREDHRGFFARSWSQNEFTAPGLHPHIVRINVAYTTKNYIPEGCAHGYQTLADDSQIDQVVSYLYVEIPVVRISDAMRLEQDQCLHPAVHL